MSFAHEHDDGSGAKESVWLRYVEAWDTYACMLCGTWLEPPCSEDDCVYDCASRPEQP